MMKKITCIRTPSDLASGSLKYGLAAAVALLTFVVYLPALHNNFVNWDDGIYVSENPDIRSLGLGFFRWAFSNVTANYWVPLTWISHAVDYHFWGLNPLGHHLTNIILHAANTFLVVYLTAGLAGWNSAVHRDCGESSEVAVSRKSCLIVAVVTGMLFGLHPLHVESVAWISERKDLLYSLFFLSAVIAYTAYVTGLKTVAAGRNFPASFLWSGKYVLSLVFFLLSLASKPMGITLPFVLLLLDWYPFKRISSFKDFLTALGEKVPFVLMGAVIMTVTLLSQKTDPTQVFLEPLPVSARVLVAFKSVMVYLLKMATPLKLSPFYPYSEKITIGSFEYYSAVILACLITAVCISLANKRKVFLAVWGYYLLVLLPVLGIIRVGDHSMADRYTYLSGLGPFFGVGLISSWIWKTADSLRESRFLAKMLVSAVAVGLVAGMSYLTIKQISIWGNGISLWDHVISIDPARVPMAYNNRGTAYLGMGQIDRAMDDFTKAIDLKPVSIMNSDDACLNLDGQKVKSRGEKNAGRIMMVNLNTAVALAYTNRGEALQKKGMSAEALEDYARAIAVNPSSAITYYNRGLMYMTTGQYKLAYSDYSRAITLDPEYILAYTNRGWLLKNLGQPELALQDYTKVIDLHPFFAVAYYNRALVYGETGDVGRAVGDYTMAISLDSGFADAYINRGLLFEDLGQLDRALADFNRAIILKPSSVQAYNNRGVALEITNQFDRAVEDYSKAISLAPDDHMAYINRATAFGKMGRMDLAARDFQRACALGSEEGCEAARMVRIK